MTFTVTIPTWVFWVIGVPLGLLGLFFLLLGIFMAFNPPKWPG